MERQGFYYLGKILKPYGNKGHLLAFFDTDDPIRYSDLDTVFIGIDKDHIPFFLKSVEVKSHGKAILKIEDIDSADDAEPFSGRELFLPLSSLPPLKGKKFYHHEVTGFTVEDENAGRIGFVESILDLPQQAIIQVRSGEKEILIPLTDEILVRVDRKKKILFIRAPEGLIDLYL